METYAIIMSRKTGEIESTIRLELEAFSRTKAVQKAVDELPGWKPVAISVTKSDFNS